MIPQSFKDIVSNAELAGMYQTLALLIFMMFFIALVVYVFSRPKNYYNEDASAPLEKDTTFNH